MRKYKINKSDFLEKNVLNDSIDFDFPTCECENKNDNDEDINVNELQKDIRSYYNLKNKCWSDINLILRKYNVSEYMIGFICGSTKEDILYNDELFLDFASSLNTYNLEFKGE